MNAPVRVMAHLVAGYPSAEIAFAAARGLAEGGVAYFEVQLPFSDPSADGPAIQKACSTVLANGYRVRDGLRFVSSLHEAFPFIPLFIMTYGNLAYRRGMDRFVGEASAAGATGLIIPDLPFDADEGLAGACLRYGVHAVPVAAPSMTGERMAALRILERPYVYAALRSGITGAATEIDGRTIAFLSHLSGTSRLLGGFGIRSGGQARVLAPHVHAVVAGSVFVNLIGTHAASGASAVREAVAAKARELTRRQEDL